MEHSRSLTHLERVNLARDNCVCMCVCVREKERGREFITV